MKIGKWVFLLTVFSQTHLLALPILWPDYLNRERSVDFFAPFKKEPASKRILIPEVKSIYVVDRVSGVTKLSPGARGIFFSTFPVPGGQKKLAERLSPYLQRPLTANDLVAIKRTIILYYRDHKHPLVSVQIPEQDVTDGKFILIVRESVLGEVRVYGNKHFSKNRYANAIRLDQGDHISEKELLNNLDFLNRNPFRQADLVYAPGKKTNTTDIEIIAKDFFPVSVYAGVDNTGLIHTDRTRWFMGASWANAFGLDQTISFQYTAAPNPHKFDAITGTWLIPLPIQHNLLLFGGYSRVHAHVKNSSRTQGTSSQVSFRYTIPFVPCPRLLHEWMVGFDFKRSNNTLNFVEALPRIGQQVNLTQFMCGYNLGYERDVAPLSHKVGFDVQLFFSPFTWIPAQSRRDFQSLNPFADPIYVYGRTSLKYKLRLPHQLRFSVLFSGQLSNKTLLPSEQLGLGGYNTVRGYDERQLNADDGFLVSTEIQSPPLHFVNSRKYKDRLEFLAFFDYGYSHDRRKPPGEKQTDYLMGIGPGVRYAFQNYLSFRLDWGIKLHQDHFPGGWSMIHFSLIGSY